MENTEQPQKPDTTPHISDAPNLPAGTYEYVETNKKRNWGKIIEISLLGIIAAVPLVLSLFQFNYSVTRVYEMVNPAYIGTTSSYDGWSGIITAARNIIMPIAKTENTNSEDTAVTATPTFPSESSQQQTQTTDQGSSGQQTNYPTQNEQSVTNSRETQQQETSQTQEYILNFQPSSSEQQSADNSEQPSPSVSHATSPSIYPSMPPYLAACSGKEAGDKCSYTTYSYKVSGKCTVYPNSNNTLVCISDQ